jgi:hypothetical protein
MLLVELRDGGVFLQPAMPVREIPLETLQEWIAEDERDAEGFWKAAGKAGEFSSIAVSSGMWIRSVVVENP